jgi:hypothetical protein
MTRSEIEKEFVAAVEEAKKTTLAEYAMYEGSTDGSAVVSYRTEVVWAMGDLMKKYGVEIMPFLNEIYVKHFGSMDTEPVIKLLFPERA